jgi:hypothetical protein
MGNPNVAYYFEESQDVINLAPKIKDCPLCNGTHGNNTLCQFTGSEYYVI